MSRSSSRCVSKSIFATVNPSRMPPFSNDSVTNIKTSSQIYLKSPHFNFIFLSLIKICVSKRCPRTLTRRHSRHPSGRLCTFRIATRCVSLPYMIFSALEGNNYRIDKPSSTSLSYLLLKELPHWIAGALFHSVLPLFECLEIYSSLYSKLNTSITLYPLLRVAKTWSHNR